MTLFDFETKDVINNPYVTLYGPKGDWVALNNETFLELRQYLTEDETPYKVCITEARITNTFTGELHASGADDAIKNEEIGYLLEDVVREFLIDSYEQLSGKTPALD
jgi:hypothetical protein